MDTKQNMIIIKGEFKTHQVISCEFNIVTNKTDVTFNNGKTYSYKCSNVKWLKDPQQLNPEMYHISRKGKFFFDIIAIYVFKDSGNSYWHICFNNGFEKDYTQRELDITKSCFIEEKSKNVFEYIKKISYLSNLRNEETGEKILSKYIGNISFVGEDVALAKYLNPSSLIVNKSDSEAMPIFPFGCNNSQYAAVINAMTQQISVIQGPPGTGKTQTILNIIANILLKEKNVQIVSNNNSAIWNVYEKLSSDKYQLNFVAAMLGNAHNKKVFVDNQETHYPEMSDWIAERSVDILQKEISDMSARLKLYFNKQEKKAQLELELSNLLTEKEHFEQYADKSKFENLTSRRISSSKWIKLWQKCEHLAEKEKRIGVLFKLRAFFWYGITNKKFYKQDNRTIITAFQSMYYHSKQTELSEEISEIDLYLSANNNLVKEFCNLSMIVLRDKLARKYIVKNQRKIFYEDNLWKNPKDVLDEYPVILSTTFSSRNNFAPDFTFDYLIMDEASQVDIATGALAISCAKNVVIVGDTKQLPNIVTNSDKNKADDLLARIGLNEGYKYSNSFLQSVLDVMPDVSLSLLREHYRCHPKIINFCNQKFYNGDLIIMTDDNGEKDVLSVFKTRVGNHSRDRYSQRQIDIIKNEIILAYGLDPSKTGIIAPYRNQVKAVRDEIDDIEVATVHKFQGREKDNIIISTVDDQISDFVDDPYLINVAVSRAKKKLILVTTGNEQRKKGNITDLIDYIKYNNFDVSDSKIYSIFDLLYKQYAEERKKYLKKRKRISEYDSENLMYSLIEDIIADDKYSDLDIACHFPICMLIKNTELLNYEEYKYASNPLTHIDFLIYSKISKKPVLAIEVDGYKYHREDTCQAERDAMKNHILDLYGIPLLRCKTNGSEEKVKIIEELQKIYDIKQPLQDKRLIQNGTSQIC